MINKNAKLLINAIRKGFFFSKHGVPGRNKLDREFYSSESSGTSGPEKYFSN